MGQLLQAYLVPHPPILVPAVGKGRENEARATLEAMRRMAREVAAMKPSRVVVLTPHGCMNDGVLAVTQGDTLTGNLQQFGNRDVAHSFTNDQEAVAGFLEAAREKNLPVRGTPAMGAMDHGAYIPLYFLKEAGADFKVMHLVTGMPLMPQEGTIGKTLLETMNALEGDWVLVVSGDLSHRLDPKGPYGYAERGMGFEKEIDAVIASGDLKRLDVFDAGWCSDAGQCGVGPLRVARGVLGTEPLETEIYSHEWPFGVGYMVARFKEVPL